ncbi:MAG: hypothetical protein IJX55_05605 [Clostridia bacterium]|nr:hypothetical protein [Clostridia bacterium]
MGSYVSTEKFFQLPIRGGSTTLFSEIFFDQNESDKEIINTLTNSNLGRIQTTKEPTEDEINILNEVFKINPNIAFRHYNMFAKEADISYLLKLTSLKSLSLELHSEITNVEVVNKLNLENLAFGCFSLKDYSFLKNASSSIKSLTIDLENKSYKMDIKDIVHITSLESLGIRNVKKGLDKLSELKNLKELYLRSVDIKDYGFLRNMDVRKIYLSFQNVSYFNTFGINESIEEVSLWMNKNLTDLNFLLQFPNLKRIIISNQKKVETIPDLTGLSNLEEIYFLEKDEDEIKKHCNPNVKIKSYYNPADIS